jgi:hypothetical protein
MSDKRTLYRSVDSGVTWKVSTSKRVARLGSSVRLQNVEANDLHVPATEAAIWFVVPTGELGVVFVFGVG